jgi:hypothetical protein
LVPQTVHLLWKCATMPVDRVEALEADDAEKVQAMVMTMVIDPSM